MRASIMEVDLRFVSTYEKKRFEERICQQKADDESFINIKLSRLDRSRFDGKAWRIY